MKEYYLESVDDEYVVILVYNDFVPRSDPSEERFKHRASSTRSNKRTHLQEKSLQFCIKTSQYGNGAKKVGYSRLLIIPIT